MTRGDGDIIWSSRKHKPGWSLEPESFDTWKVVRWDRSGTSAKCAAICRTRRVAEILLTALRKTKSPNLPNRKEPA